MRSINHSIYLIIIVVLAVLLFRQCNQTVETNSKIPYNRDSALAHVITLDTAVKYTLSFRAGRIALARQLRPGYLDSVFNLPFATKFNRDAIAMLLNQKGAKGMRIYFGRNNKGKIKMMLVAVDGIGRDIINGISDRGTLKATKVLYILDDGTMGETGIFDKSQDCPSMCDPNSPLYH